MSDTDRTGPRGGRTPSAIVKTGQDALSRHTAQYVNQIYADSDHDNRPEEEEQDITERNENHNVSDDGNDNKLRRRSVGSRNMAWSDPDFRDPEYRIPDSRHSDSEQFPEVTFRNVYTQPHSASPKPKKGENIHMYTVNRTFTEHSDSAVNAKNGTHSSGEMEDNVTMDTTDDNDSAVVMCCRSNKVCHRSPKRSSKTEEKKIKSILESGHSANKGRSADYRVNTPDDSLSVASHSSSYATDVETGSNGTKSRRQRLRWLFYAIPGFLLFLLFLILMPVSFVYVSFDKMALLRSKLTGVVDLDVTYYPGCYVLGPQSQFLLFPRTGVMVKWDKLSVFSASRLELNVDVSFLYHIRSEDLGEMYATYATEYESILYKITEANLKNTAAQFTLDEYRLKRPLVEESLHNVTREKLAGHYVDVDFFWMGEIAIPEIVSQRLEKSLLQQVEAETAAFEQKKVLTDIGTTQFTQMEENKKNELLRASESVGSLIVRSAVADADRLVQTAEISAWDSMCTSLGINREDLRMSMLYIRSLDTMENLYWAPSEPGRNYSYTQFPGFDRNAYESWKMSK